MSIKSALYRWPILLLVVLLSGCLTEDVIIHLNPDGSGMVEYTSHFDRAPDDLREKIRKQMQGPGMRRSLSREHILENYPEPHFHLLEFEDDMDALRTRLRMEFQDINALLISRKEAPLGLDSLDFSVQGDRIDFSLKEEKLGKPMPEELDENPGLERITIINSQSGESVVFERELTSATQPADWSGALAFPGHKIERKRGIQVFHDYPVVKAPVCEVEQAQWLLRHHRQWSSLALDLLAAFPDDGKTYIRWEKPVVMSGGFLPKGDLRFVPTGSTSGQGKFELNRAQKIELKFDVPTNRVNALSASTIRIQAHRCDGSSMVEVGKLEPNTEYAVGNSTLKTTGMENNQVSFTLTGEADRLKNAFVETKRGNRFMLKRASWSSSGADKTTVSYWELLPVEDCTLLLELHNKTEPCYIDLPIPLIDLTQRAWRVDNPDAKPVSDRWKEQLAAEHPELFEIDVPPVEAVMFEEKERYEIYFQGLEDRQLLSAIVQVVDYMVQHNPQKGEDWLQSYAQMEIQEREEFLKSSRPSITAQLFALYRDLPAYTGCVGVFFPNLGLSETVQPMAVEQLGQGNMRFAKDGFFGRELAADEIKVLKEAFASADSWMDQKALLEILDRTGSADAAFINNILTDGSTQEIVRGAALRIALKTGEFPGEELSICMADSEFRKSAVNALDQYLNTFLRSSKNGSAERAALKASLEPIVPLLQDLSEQLKQYDAKPAVSVLEKLKQLEVSQP